MKENYQKEIREIIQKHLGKDVGVFVFGSAIKKDSPGDIDVGVAGSQEFEKKAYLIRDELEESNIPYKVDIINFDEVDDEFKNKVLKEKITWLT